MSARLIEEGFAETAIAIEPDAANPKQNSSNNSTRRQIDFAFPRWP
jgi:hypothetical protein